MKKTLIILGITLVIAVLVWFFFFKGGTEDPNAQYAGNTQVAEEHAITLARDRVQNDPLYVERDGRDLVFEKAVYTACDGCWEVTFGFEQASRHNSLQTESMTGVVSFHYWEIIDVVYEMNLRALTTPEQCTVLGGRILTTTDGSSCDASEENIGDVSGAIVPQICCVKRVQESEDDGVEYLRVSVGESFEIKVPSNPTTGYQWKVLFDDKQLELTESRYIEAKDKELLGSPGEELFVFKALSRGNTKISLEYIRAFEPGTPPILERAYAVTVE